MSTASLNKKLSSKVGLEVERFLFMRLKINVIQGIWSGNANCMYMPQAIRETKFENE
jgi:hypothetical protein